MAGEGWREWSFDGTRTAALWRAFLFVPLFLLILQVELLLVPGLANVQVIREGSLSPGIVGQAGLILIAAMAAGWVLARWDGVGLSSLGFGLDRRVPRELAAGLGVGAGSIAVVVAVLTVAGIYEFGRDAGDALGYLWISLVSLLVFLVPAAAEEAVFRGYPFRMLVAAVGPVAAVAVMSALFAVVHGGNPEVGAFGLVNIGLAGVLLAVAVLRTGSLWLATAVHLGWNWAMAGPLDLPVSGVDAFDAPVLEPSIGGPSWLSGGAFGPEGGLAGTLAALLMLLGIVWITRDGGVLAVPSANRGSHG